MPKIRIPESVDLRSLTLSYLKKSDETELNGNEIRSYNSTFNYIAWIIGYLSRKREGTKDKFHSLYAFTLKNRCDKYANINGFLIEKEVIFIDRSYRPQEKSLTGRPMGYKLGKSIDPNKLIDVVLPKKSFDDLVRQIKMKTRRDKDKSRLISDVHSKMHEFVKTEITIELDNAFESDSYIEDVWEAIECHEKLKQGIVCLTSSKTVNRIHHVLTNLSRGVRKKLRLRDGRALYSLDISASHPFLCIAIFEDKRDKAELQKLINGDLYQVLADLVGLSREEFKEKNMYFLYGDWDNKKIDAAYAKLFPSLLRAAKEKRREKKQNVLWSHEIMRLESEMILNRIGSKLVEKGIGFFSIHDAIFTSEENVSVSKNVIEQNYKEVFGLVPKIKLEQVSSD